MAQNLTLHGTVYSVPETGERGWGSTVTSLLVKLGQLLEALSYTIASIAIPRTTTASNSLVAGATITQTAGLHRVQGAAAAVTLSVTTPIATTGALDGVILELEGMSDTNTVTITDSGTVDLNGDFTLYAGSGLRLIWNSTRSLWVEKYRRD